jgi:hypothetical protein
VAESSGENSCSGCTSMITYAQSARIGLHQFFILFAGCAMLLNLHGVRPSVFAAMWPMHTSSCWKFASRGWVAIQVHGNA